MVLPQPREMRFCSTSSIGAPINASLMTRFAILYTVVDISPYLGENMIGTTYKTSGDTRLPLRKSNKLVRCLICG